MLKEKSKPRSLEIVSVSTKVYSRLQLLSWSLDDLLEYQLLCKKFSTPASQWTSRNIQFEINRRSARKGQKERPLYLPLDREVMQGKAL